MRLVLFHSVSARVDRHQAGAQSSPCRRLAAAANGPITRLASDSAHKSENGVPNDIGPVMAACEAATPKISTGIDNGNTSPASSVNATAAVEVASRFSNSPSTGVAMTSGNPAASQCASALAAQLSSSGV